MKKIAMDKKKLIELVKLKPVLYDPEDVKFKNKKFKRNLWAKIAKEINEDAEKVREAWRNLKKTYVQVKKKKQGRKSKKWRFEDDLEFIAKTFKGKNLIKTESDYNTPSEQECSKHSESKNVLALIKAVKSHDVLYARHNPRAKDVKNAWKIVSDKLEISVTVCQRRWNYLQRQYKSALKARNRSRTKRIRWKYSNEMKFLQSYVEGNLNKKKKIITNKKYPTKTMKYFASMTNNIKQLPRAEQGVLEELILHMILEAELEHKKSLLESNDEYETNNANQLERVRQPTAGEVSAECEFMHRVKFETEQYGVKELSKSQSVETPPEEYIIKVLPDSTEIKTEKK